MSTTEQELRGRYGLPPDPERERREAVNKVEEGYKQAAEQQALTIYQQEPEERSRAARILNVAGRTGLPIELIQSEGALEDLEQRVRLQDFDPAQWQQESPVFARFAAENPYHLSVLEADKENLTWVEREWTRPLSLARQMAEAQVEVNQIWNRRAKGEEYWQDTDMDRIELLQSRIQEHDFAADNLVASVLTWTVQNIGPTVYTLWSAKEEAMAGAMTGALIGGKMGGGAGTMLAPGPGTVLGSATGALAGWGTGGTIGFAVGGGDASFEMMRGEQYGRFIQAGFSHEDAAYMSTITGSISTLPELAGVGRMIKHIPGVGEFTDWTAKQVASRLSQDVLANQSYRAATKQLIGRYGTNLGIEVGTEIFQDSVATVGQNYLAATRGKHEASIGFSQWVDDISNTAVQTIKGTLLIAAIGPGTSYVADRRRAKQAKIRAQVFGSLAESLTNSSTRTEAPGTFRKFVERVSEAADGGIYINANRWDSFWQENNEDPDAMAERLGIDLEVLQLARESDHSVEIPAVAFAEQLAPSKLYDGIAPDLHFTENGMSLREADLFEKNKPQIMQDIEASIESLQKAENQVDADRIVKQVQEQLIGALTDERMAGYQAQLYRGFGVIADKLGMAPEALFDQFFGGVRRVTPDALLRTKVTDPMIDPLINRLRRNDFPTEKQQFGESLFEFIDAMGGLDPTDPELAAMDFELGAMDLGISKAQMKRWKEGGRLVSEVAESAAEQGFIPEYNEAMLLESISRELGGERVYGTRDEGDQQMRQIAADMDQLGAMVEALGLDLEGMSNDEVRAALEAADTYDQKLQGEELRQVLSALANVHDKHSADANEVDMLLARAESLMPLVYSEQDFGDVRFPDTFVLEDTQDTVEVSESAQQRFDEAVERKNTLKRLLRCISG